MQQSNKHLLVIIILFFVSIASFSIHAKSYDWVNLTPQQYIDNLVSCQVQLKEYKWSKTLWPKENTETKPGFNQVLNLDQVRQQVIDSLKMQSLLEDKFNISITDNMLQNDIIRMANNTKDADSLKEMFALYNNDPLSIAQCISRPYLVQKKTQSNYNWYNDIHGEIKQLAQLELKNYLKNKNTGNLTAEINVITYTSNQEDEASFKNSSDKETIINITKEEYDQKLQQLNNNNLQEKQQAFIYTEILKQTTDSIKTRNLVWYKKDFNTWIKNQSSRAYFPQALDAEYFLPEITGSINQFNKNAGVTADTWKSQYYPTGRYNHTAIWTGTHMIVWGGVSVNHLNTGGRYDPVRDTWLNTNTSGAPTGRQGHKAIWTGSQMIIWGGAISSLSKTNTGGRYDPISDSWLSTSVTGAPQARLYHTAIWTGSEMVIWGGENSNTGGRYNPISDSWVATRTIGAPSGRDFHTAIWTGTEMIIWGGNGSNSGGRYNPSNDSWAATTTSGAPSGRRLHTAIWTGTEMIVWGGDGGGYLNSGGRYNPSNNSWLDINASTAPTARSLHTAVWTGTQMIIWGGYNGNDLNTGSRYDLGTDSWLDINTSGTPTNRRSHSAVWTGTEMVVWGGYFSLNTGGRYNPTNDSWKSTRNSNSAPAARNSHSAIWTGTQMVIWGGIGSGNLNSGSRYDPSSDNWLSTTTSGAPSGRNNHTAIWTGTHMIIWGGSNGNSLKTGGRYDPLNNTWMSTTVSGAPVERNFHSAVWTGTYMVVWGGSNSNVLNTGGRYDPVNNSWLSTTTLGAPAARRYHTAFWTGSKMIIWGGAPIAGYYKTGGRYDPINDSWLSTNSIDAPTARSLFSSVWTGNQMIVWGGLGGIDTGSRYDPVDDSWLSTSSIDAPVGRFRHTAVWTGSEMIIWGGNSFGVLVNQAVRYDPINDIWSSTNSAGAPIGRVKHTSIWSGNEMIIWGGDDFVENFNSIGIYYTANTYTVGGAITGLTGDQVVLQNNSDNDLTLTSNGNFSFYDAVSDGSNYDVTVLTNPSTPSQTCTVINGTGSNITTNITNISVNCISNYNVNVSVTGLSASSSIELTTNGQSLNLMGSGGPTNFPNPISNGSNYAVVMTAAPTMPSQSCNISGGNSGNNDGTGTIVDADVAITIDCVTNSYDINITVTGLATSNFVSFANGISDTSTLNSNTTTTLSTLIDESAYAVSITSQPDTPSQTCEFTNTNSGNLAGTDVEILVSCTTDQFYIGGMTTGLVSNNPVILGLGAENLVVTDTIFVFVNPLDDESNYTVSITNNPAYPKQTCILNSATGQIATADIVNIEVDCTTNQYSIGGTVNGLHSGNNLILQNNNSDDLFISNDGAFNFNAALDDLSPYNAVIISTASSPIQSCIINGGFGSVAGSDVSSIEIICEFGSDLIFKNGF